MGSPSLTIPNDALFDSNIPIDYLPGRTSATDVLGAAGDAAISIVTAIEVLAGARDGDWPQVQEFLRRFRELPVDLPIRDMAARVRRDRRLKLPDGIILATAIVHAMALVTRNSRDFAADDPLVVIPYTLP